MPSSHLVVCCPLLLLPSIFPSIRVFSNESVLHIRWPKYWSFSLSIIPSKEHPGLISFRMDWLDLLAVQGTLKSLLQKHSSKASILWCSAFLMVQLSHPYMTTGKTIALTRWTFVGKLFYWSVVNLQCCVNFYCTLKWYVYILFHILFHDGLSQGFAVIHSVYHCFHLLIPNSQSTPPSPPWQRQFCSLCLGVCVCFVDKLICVIF